MMGYMLSGGWLWMVFGFLLFVLFWGGIIWLIVWGVRKATEQRDSSGGNPGPLDIAKARYARGEITREQFDQIKKDIS